MSNPGNSLDERTKRFIASLQEHPELQARFEGVMALVDNANGDTLTADDAEQRVVEELQLLGREALQCWAQRKATVLEQEYDGRRDYQRKGKKDSTGKPGMVR
ncbi:MAG: hypothetical protein M3R15_34155 [Acidobacteriota bacterium]|nr:hypothetical protein [Acidobacteriota bacterium]